MALAAPTGRAAKRLEELCGAPASTLHRLLGAQPRTRGEEVSFAGGFARNRDWPLDEDVVVVDEASMLDVELANASADRLRGRHASALRRRCGPAAVDRSRTGARRPHRLRRRSRDSAPHAVPAGRGRNDRPAGDERPRGELPPVDDPTREVVIVAARGSADAAHRVVQLVTDSIPRVLAIPAHQVQVVTPMHRGPAGTQALNAALKAQLNPGDGRHRFDVGDRVVATANHLEAEPFGYANGEVGVVAEVEPDGTVTVEFASGPAEVKGKALGRPAARLGDHGASGAGFGVPGGRRGAAARGGHDAVATARLHRADPRAAAPVGRARGRSRAGASGTNGRCAATPDPADRAADPGLRATDLGRPSGVNRAVGVEWRVMTAAGVEADADPDWEYAPLRIPADVTRVSAAVRLSLHAEYGGWELARVLRYTDGSRRVWLRRPRPPASDLLPLPGLIH